MAVVRELRAKFTAEAKALKSVMEDVKRSTRDLAKGQDTARKSMQGVGRESDTMSKKFKMADGRMATLNRSASDTGKTFSNTDKNVTTLGKNLTATGNSTAGASKSFQSMNGQAVSLNRTFGDSVKTFKTAGGSLTSLGRHFSSAEVSAIGAGRQFQSASGQMMSLNRTASESARAFKTTGGSITSLGKHFSSAEVSAVTMSRGIETAGGRMMTLNRTAGESARTFRTTGGSITELGRHFTSAETNALRLGRGVTTASSGVSNLDETVGRSARTFRTSGQNINELGRHFTAAETNARLMGDGVRSSGEAVANTSRGIRQNVDGQISSPFEGAAQKVKNFGRSVRDIVASLGVFTLIERGIGMVTESLSGAIDRYDTLNNFPRVLELMGFDAEQSSKAIDRLSEGIDGLPTTLDSVVSTAQRIASMTGDIDGAVETTLALNNAFLASGASAGDAQRGLEQYVQMLSKGEVDLASWRSLQETMPVALVRTAEAFGYTGRSAQNDLYDALKNGEVTFDQFNKKIIELSNKTGGFADMARESGAGIKTSWTNMKTAIVRGTANMIKATDEAMGGVGSIAGGIEKMKNGVNSSFKQVEKAIPPLVGAFQKHLLPSVREVGRFARDYLVPSLKALYDNLKPLAVMVGTALASAFQALIGALNNLLGPTIKYLSKMKLLGPILAGILGTMAAYKAITIGVTTAQKIYNTVTKLSIALSRAYRAAQIAMAISGGGVRGMLLAMRAAMAALNITMLANPFVLITSLIIGLGVAVVAAYKKFDGFKKVVDGTWAFIKDAFKMGVEDVKSLIDIFTGHWKNMLEVWKAIFSGDFPKAFDLLKDGIKDTLGKIGDIFKRRFDVLDKHFGDSMRSWTKSFIGWADSIREKSPLVDAAFRGIETAITVVRTAIKEYIDVAKQVLPIYEEFVRSVADGLKKLFSGDLKGAFKTFKDAFAQMFTDLKEIAMERLAIVWEVIKEWILTTGSRIKDSLVSWKDAFKDRLTEIKDDVLQKLHDIGSAVLDWIVTLPDRIKDKLVSWKDAFVERVVDIKDATLKKFDEIGTAIIDWITTMPGRMKAQIKEWGRVFDDWIQEQNEENKRQYGEWGNTILDWFKEMPGKMGKELGEWSSTIFGWVRDKKAEWTNALSEWTSRIVAWFADLPKRTGEWLSGWMKSIAQWIRDMKSEWATNLGEWTSSIVQWFRDLPGKTAQGLSDWFKNIRESIIGFKDRFVEAFNSWWDGLKDWFKDIGKKAEVKNAGKDIVKSIASGSEDEKQNWQDRIGQIIVDGLKYMLMIGLVIALSVGRELIKRMIDGVQEMKASFEKKLGELTESLRNKLTEMVNSVQTKWDDIKTRTTKFLSDMQTSIQTKWDDIKKRTDRFVSDMLTSIQTKWNDIKSRTSKFLTDLLNDIQGKWNDIKIRTSRFLTDLLNDFQNKWNDIKARTSRFVSDMLASILAKWNDIRTRTSEFTTNMQTSINNGWEAVKRLTTKAFTTVYDTVKGKFDDIVTRAKELPKRIGDGIGSMASKVTSGVTKVINTMASTLGKGINGVIGGVNWVLGKIGVKNEIPKWTVPQYAKGTDGHPGGLAVVGDGKGAYKGQELIQHPDGTAYLSPDTDTLVNLPAGTQVLNAQDTENLLYPHYAKGIGSKIKDAATNAWDKTKEIGGKVKDAALDVFSYVKNPGKLLDLALSALGVSKPSGDNFVGWMAKGAFGKVKDGAVAYIKNMLEKFGGDFTGGKFGPPFRLTSRAGMRFHPIYKRWQMHYGDDYGAPMGTPVPSQSGGVVTQAGFNKFRGNFLRVKSGIYEFIYQHLQQMYAGMGQTVRKGMTLGTVGRTGSATGPHLHFEIWKNGGFVPPVSMGYADGGIVDRKQLAWIAEGGWAESIISHDPAKRVSQQAIWEQTGKELGFAAADNPQVVALLRRIASLMEGKRDVNMDGQKIAEILEPYIDILQGGKSSFRKTVSRG